MKIPGYIIDLDEAIKTINENSYQTIAVQMPEGIKKYISFIVDYIENNTNSNVIVIADPCFGACDLPNHALKTLNIQLVLNIGHAPIPTIQKGILPIQFINAQSNIC